VNERVLRQLYDARKIFYATDAEIEAAQNMPLVPEAAITEAQAAAARRAEIQQTSDDPATKHEQQVAEQGESEGGDETTSDSPTGEEREALIKRIANRFNHDELFTKARGLKGVTKSQTKAQIAEALVDAGRIGDAEPS
jgi:hypothetical protein